MVLTNPSMPGVYSQLGEIQKSAAFWYNNTRLDVSQAHELLPRFVVQAGNERGQLQRRGNDVDLWA